MHVSTFEGELATLLPETHDLLETANLVVHNGVSRIVLHGSRGLAGGHHPDSDIDLSLIVNGGQLPPAEPAREVFLRDVLQTTLRCWRGPVEADLCAIFETRTGGLKPFDATDYDPHLCPAGATEGFCLFKIQKGFDGYVDAAGLQIELMYPCLTIWRR
jgi:hypothetical protein